MAAASAVALSVSAGMSSGGVAVAAGVNVFHLRRRPPSREQLMYLSRKLGRDWKDLGRFLNIDDPTLDSFEKEHRTQEASYQMLRYWVQLNGRNATIENLAEGLRRAGRADLAEKLAIIESSGDDPLEFGPSLLCLTYKN